VCCELNTSPSACRWQAPPVREGLVQNIFVGKVIKFRIQNDIYSPVNGDGESSMCDNHVKLGTHITGDHWVITIPVFLLGAVHDVITHIFTPTALLTLPKPKLKHRSRLESGVMCASVNHNSSRKPL
jgi:hypothetical protein